jgi:CheY-like chemotaxis protein
MSTGGLGAPAVARTPPSGSPRPTSLEADARRSSTGERPSDGKRPAAPARVLVVEDVPDEQELLATLLRAQGWEVGTAADGLEALALIERAPPEWFSLVVIDHKLPRLSGVEVVARASSRAPFIMVTGMRDPVLRRRAMSLGARAVLHKPINILELVRLARDAVGADEPGR